MKYYLIHSSIGYYIDIVNDIVGVKHPFIEIDKKTADDIVEARSKKLVVRVVNGVIEFTINLNLKRAEIVKERDVILESVLPYVNSSWYREDNIEGLNAEIESEIRELYKRLCDMPTHFDNSEDKQNWSYKWVDEYTSGKNTNTYQIKRLDYIKWKK